MRGAWADIFLARPMPPGLSAVAAGTAFLAALALRLALEPLLVGTGEFLTFFPAVFLAALWGGVWAGATVTTATVLAVCLLVHEPLFGLAPWTRDVTARMAAFAASAALLTAAGVAVRRLVSRLDRREADLRRGGARRQALLDAMTSVVFQVDAAERMEPLKGWRGHTGLTWRGPDDLVRALHPEDRDAFRGAWAEAMDAHRPLEGLEVRLWKGEARDWCWVELAFVPVREPDGSTSREWVGLARDIHHRKESERLQDLLAGELNHRVKNLFAVIRSLARQTARSCADPADFADVYLQRLDALAAAHGVLLDEGWESACLVDLAERVLASFIDGGHVSIDGPELKLRPATALALTLALHELATNACKYGALSGEAGRVDLSWRVGSDGRFRLEWRETGGPVVSAPDKEGFGGRVIREALSGEPGREVTMDYRADGLVCRMGFDMEAPEHARAASETVA